ncbi:MAG: alpha/beta fold hydrolase [Candidatus Heimdallarchaeota archaeon]
MMSTGQLQVENGMQLAILTRIARDTNNLAIFFIHGFGCAKEDFASAFTDSALAEFDLVALDLPGHGQSSKPEDFDYSISNLARIALEALDRLAIGSFHLCAHSMGGLIGLEMIERQPEVVRSFMNLEGNLSSEDCFLTRKIIGYSFNDFVASGRKSIENELERSMQVGYIPSSYLESFKRASDAALYYAARSTVTLSDDPHLMSQFIGLKSRCYVYGEKNKGNIASEQQLLLAGVPVYYVDNAGHAMAEDNPSALNNLLKTWIAACDRSYAAED